MNDLRFIAALKPTPGHYNDIDIGVTGATGDIVMIGGADRVRQDVVKILLTDLPPPYTIGETNVAGTDVSNIVTYIGFTTPSLEVGEDRTSAGGPTWTTFPPSRVRTNWEIYPKPSRKWPGG
jgi:hypothetical protein